MMGGNNRDDRNHHRLDRLRMQDEQLLIELAKKFFTKLSFRTEPTFHSEQWAIHNAMTNVELAKSQH